MVRIVCIEIATHELKLFLLSAFQHRSVASLIYY